MKKLPAKRPRRSMTSGPEPRIFHRQFGSSSGHADIREIYPKPYVAKLCSDYRITEPKHVEALWSFLAFAASAYFIQKTGKDDRAPLREVGSQLASVAQLAERLRGQLAQLDDKTERWLWRPERSVSAMLLTEPVTRTEFGLTILREDIDEKTYRVHHLNRADILEAIAVVGNYARHGIEQLPINRGSRPRASEAVRIWMTNAQSFWINVLGRRFTRLVHGSEGVSEAARFCIDAIKPLAPGIKTSVIDTTMERLVTQHNKRTAINPAEK